MSKITPAIQHAISIRKSIESMADDIMRAAPKNSPISVERVAALVFFDLKNPKNEKLLKSTPESIFQCIMYAVQLGLEPGSQMKQLYLVPYKPRNQKWSVATPILGVEGLKTLAWRGGHIDTIYTSLVRKDDQFKVVKAPEQMLSHEEAPFGSSEIIGAYGNAGLKNGRYIYRTMSVEEINKIRDNSPDYRFKKDDSIWAKHWEPMAEKTVMRQTCKHVPTDSWHLRLAVSNDERFDAGADMEIDVQNDMDHRLTAAHEKYLKEEAGKMEQEALRLAAEAAQEAPEVDEVPTPFDEDFVAGDEPQEAVVDFPGA